MCKATSPVVESIGTLVGIISRTEEAGHYSVIEIQVEAYLDWINSKLA